MLFVGGDVLDAPYGNDVASYPNYKRIINVLVGATIARPCKTDVTSHPNTSSVNLRLTPSPEGKARRRSASPS